MTKLNNIGIIETHIEQLAASIMSENMMEKDVIVSKIETFIISAINTLIGENVSLLEKEVQVLKAEMAAGMYDYDPKLKMSKMYHLGALKDKVKEQNRAAHATKDYSEYNILKQFVKARCGQSFLEEYYALQTTQKVELMKPIIHKMAKQLKSQTNDH